MLILFFCYCICTVDIHTGTHFWIIGSRYSSHGRYGVSVDGGLFEVFSNQEPNWRSFVILYERRFADLGPHRVVIRNEDDKTLVFDAIMYVTGVQLGKRADRHCVLIQLRSTSVGRHHFQSSENVSASRIVAKILILTASRRRIQDTADPVWSQAEPVG